jgi:TonB family protein
MRLALLLLCSVVVLGQSAPRVPEQGVVEILSDTQGVDFGPYLKEILATVRKNWFSLIPDSAKTKKGKLVIEFAITKDGHLADMRLTATSGDKTLDRPAWSGIVKSDPFPALPKDFKGPFIALRFRFDYNPDKKLIARAAGLLTAPSFTTR